MATSYVDANPPAFTYPAERENVDRENRKTNTGKSYPTIEAADDGELVGQNDTGENDKTE